MRKEHYPVDGQILDLEGTSKFIGQHTFFTDGDTESHGDNVTCPDDRSSHGVAILLFQFVYVFISEHMVMGDVQ